MNNQILDNLLELLLRELMSKDEMTLRQVETNLKANGATENDIFYGKYYETLINLGMATNTKVNALSNITITPKGKAYIQNIDRNNEERKFDKERMLNAEISSKKANKLSVWAIIISGISIAVAIATVFIHIYL